MADDKRNCILFIALFSCLLYSSYSYQFVVGGRDGWIVKPSQNYRQWAGRMRFQINDTLLFRYKSGSDSVLVVSKDDYDNCNTTNPNFKFDDGNSIFKFDRSGPFYFITGNKSNCDQGQKLHLVVISIRTPPSPPRVPFPTAAPPLGSSPSQSPAGGSVSPKPAISLSPYDGAPTPAKSTPLSPSLAYVAPAPAGSGPAPSETPSPSTAPGSPSSSIPGSPDASPPGSEAPADGNAPPPRRSSAAPPCSSYVFLISTVSLVLSVGMCVFVNSP